MQNLLNDLTDLLQSEQSYISDGSILKNVVIEAALNMDSTLLRLLLQSDKIKRHFFTDVAGTLVFDKVKFQSFVSNKAFLPDSYTAFKNRIGLVDARGDYISQSRDVVLAWPYKDCVLEGGMTKEDSDREEIFWNSNLAPDDITRLFEPKILTGWERWNSEAIATQRAKPAGKIGANENLLVKGNNLLTLHSLKARYSGKVKLVYIDPPYNTGKDGFHYNDRFNHSTWLTFMKNRLEVARDLLCAEGAIFVNLDDGEAHYCKVLMDEIFGRENFVTNVIWQKKYTRSNDAKWFSNNHDHILVFGKDKTKLRLNPLEKSEKQLSAYSNPDNHPKGVWKSTPLHAKSGGKNSLYKHTFKNGVEWSPPINTYPRFSAQTLTQLDDNDEIYFGINGTATPRRKTFLSETKDGLTPITIWEFREFGHNHEANSELKALNLPSHFQNPKPEKLLKAIISLATNPGDLVVDFFCGSGTTPAVAHKLQRRWIAVEQMDYIHELPYARLKKVITGDSGGISKAVDWQGGGSFLYAELATFNAGLAYEIRSASRIETLDAIKSKIQSIGFLRHDVDIDSLEISKIAHLSLEDAKRVLLDCLDANHLYANLGSIGDASFCIAAEDAATTRSFYELDK